ncbi:tyrosine-type recombinase/integrase [Mycobacteroides immunogenum]|uniref:Integrase n=1 Tax=Mycobacteroides immunogenum TaxID=83262 RepID=A0A7V8LL38_9MYCO|nr:site-specific integrase [Mycobacteroides immunogenum]AMT72144.1 integrase [Mycobacteroides immunogenum]ANO05276.1 integrase [Mycobacteroides immunogenum]KIU37993.1 integrase [Mycobacteroides immunogenum]KPG04212.1 integrase [Mycobacteroides immunogenum]KPG04921.1 integrase [Mycobacteroides immunogenum]
MASIRERQRRDGSPYFSVLYRLDGQQTSLSVNDRQEAEYVCELINRLGPARALEILKVSPKPRAKLTVEAWIRHHIDHLTGVDKRTIEDYNRFLRNDIASHLGPIPLDDLTRDDIARWVSTMEGVSSPKTIANKHGFLSGALAGAVTSGKLKANPAAGIRLPQSHAQEMVFLTREQFAELNDQVTEPWRPFVEFLVASGCRLSEATALRPDDVDQAAGTVRIWQSWRRGGGGYRLAPPKTERSKRTINVGRGTLEKLTYSGEWLFTNSGRGRRAESGPVRPPNFRANVWWPAVERTALPRKPRIHDLRHTCASWMILAGVPLPVVQRHLGHESIQTTVDLYGHIDRASAEAAANAIANMLAMG